jgi:hypothetical protein
VYLPVLLAMFVMLSGITQCNANCPDGNGGTEACISCSISPEVPCKARSWNQPEGTMCDAALHPDLPDGEPCDFNAIGDGVCMSGACTGDPPFPCTEQGILDAIAAGGGPHFFDCAGPTTINTSGYIDIDNDVVLDAEGNITLDGGGTHGLIAVPPGVTAELIGFTIQGAGGLGQVAFVSSGDVTLRDVNFTNNIPTTTATGAVYNSGVLTVFGGVYAGNSTIACGPTSCGSPFASDLVNEGTANLYRVTLSEVGNAQTFDGDEFSIPGVLNIYDSFLNVAWYPQTVSNCTVGASGAIVGGEAPTTISNSTLVGALLWDSVPGETLTVRGSIVSFADPAALADAIVVSEGFNIYGTDTGAFDQPTDQLDPGLLAASLGELADNGGPTPTLLPGPGSIAINAIPAAECLDADGAPLTTDQRGISRPQGSACDIGAVEVEPAFSPTCGGCSVTIAAVGYTTPSCGLGFRQVNPDDPDGTRRNLGGCGDERCASVDLNLFYCEPGTTYEIELFHTGGTCNRDTIDVVNYTVGCPTP